MSGVVLTGSFDGVAVVGRPDLTEAQVTGPHELRREGETLVVEGTAGGAAATAASVGATVGNLKVTVSVGEPGRQVVVAVPEDTDVVADLDAANVSVSDLGGSLRVTLGAGAVDVDGCRGATDIRVRTGAAAITPAEVGCTVRTRVGVGTVSLPDGAEGELVIGDGAVPVDVEVDVGSVKVRPSQARSTSSRNAAARG